MITFCAFFAGLYTLAFSRIRKDYRELNSKGLLIAEIITWLIAMVVTIVICKWIR